MIFDKHNFNFKTAPRYITTETTEDYIIVRTAYIGFDGVTRNIRIKLPRITEYECGHESIVEYVEMSSVDVDRAIESSKSMIVRHLQEYYYGNKK